MKNSSKLGTNIRIIEAALKIAITPEIKVINGMLYLQGKLLNEIMEKISECYQQYCYTQKDYNPKAIFPEEIKVASFVDETFFPLLHFQNSACKRFKLVVGMKLEE